MRGADFLKIKLPFTPREIQKFAGQLIGKNELAEAVLRVTLTRGAGRARLFDQRCRHADAGA